MCIFFSVKFATSLLASLTGDKRLKAIREKSDRRKLEREREKEREIRRERERVREREKASENQKEGRESKIEVEKSKSKTNTKSKEHSQEKQNLTEDETIVRDYDVEFYMKRGLTKNEAINYIKNKLSVSNLWSKMSKAY